MEHRSCRSGVRCAIRCPAVPGKHLLPGASTHRLKNRLLRSCFDVNRTSRITGFPIPVLGSRSESRSGGVAAWRRLVSYLLLRTYIWTTLASSTGFFQLSDQAIRSIHLHDDHYFIQATTLASLSHFQQCRILDRRSKLL